MQPTEFTKPSVITRLDAIDRFRGSSWSHGGRAAEAVVMGGHGDQSGPGPINRMGDAFVELLVEAGRSTIQ